MSPITESSATRIRYNQDGTRRQGKLLTLQGVTNRNVDGQVEIDHGYLYVHVASFLAWKHAQERNGVILPSLPQVLGDCDFDWSLESRDTQFSPVHGVRALVAATTDPTPKVTHTHNNNNYTHTHATGNYTHTHTMTSPEAQPQAEEDWQMPFGIVGSVYSSVTLPITAFGQGFSLPQTSGGAISGALESAPFFSRTIPTSVADARAVMAYYHSQGVSHIGCIHVKDAWGNYFNTDLQIEAKKLGISIVSFSYDLNNRESILSALEQLKDTGRRHIFAIMFDWKAILEVALDLDIIGNPDYAWIGAAMIDWTSPQLQFNRHNPKEQRLAQALNGVGSLVVDGGSNTTAFHSVMREFANNPALQQEYIQSYPPEEQHMFDNFTFTTPPIDQYQNLFYDATYSLAIAACQTPGLFSGEDLYQTLINLKFEGVTGPIEFDNITGTRKPHTTRIRLDNVFWSEERSDDNYIRFESRLAAMATQGTLEHYHPWIYNDNTTNIPPSLPPFDHDYNMMPLAVQVIGWLLGGFVICLSLIMIGWTWKNRKIYVVRAGQPQFLSQLCVGTLLMALAVIPMSAQGKHSNPRLDMACMTSPWLICLGFVIAFSALFSKTWRLNQLMKSGMSMKRITVEAKDVLWPFVGLVTINVAMLLGWSIASPLRYTRVEASNNVDEYGRALESYGRCQSQDTTYAYFLIPMLLFDLLAVLGATYQSYVARNLPTTLSESSYLALGMASLLESLLLGGPIYFTVVDNPTASYLVGSALLCIISLTILLPVFLPKYLHRKQSGSGRPGTLVSTLDIPSAPVSTLARQNGVADLTDASTRSTPFGSHESKAGFMFITRIHDTPPIPKKGNGRPRHGSTVPASKTGPMDASSQANETTFTRPSQQPETKSKRENHLDMGVHTV
ncbi:Gamma-aminobutyric acid (GABA) B receptor [Seminavis robusta]|uniref:Gamma-aminobutyric acid (GABA) B receptor n=1 Tax=Seminavis robusta TaxID=568900 RepID=A0A9N8DMF7_9STRA|nr:Gamma-aminobutyric acid (GABA) B receptor [Seminavis robusta]|eukprot:Sro242_g096690.1 Gamma-aminobutyric acid (GABA) B receptor (901) ;mRNA; r:65261-67963